MPDLIWKHFDYGQNWPELCMPDLTSRNRFSSVFPKKSWIIILVQNQPGSDQNGLVRVWPNTSGLAASWCAEIIWPGFWQDATGPLPVSHFQTWFCSSPDVLNNVQNQPGSHLVLADCVRFGPNGSGPEASRCAGIIRPASGQCGSYLLAVLMYLFIKNVLCECNFAF